MERIGFIGGGNMAEALIKGIIKAGAFRKEQILVSDIKSERLTYFEKTYKISTFNDNKILAGKTDIIILSVEPQQMAGVLEEIKNSFKTETLFISIAAGKKISFFTDVLGDIRIIRVMPNTPALIGAGACGIFAPEKARDCIEKAVSIFSSVGKVFVVESEELIDSVTATSGSGPAYYFLLMEAMIKAATKLGFEESVARKLVIQTAKGASLLADSALEQGKGPKELREKIVSRGGTTEAALKTFTKAGFEKIVDSAMKSAHKRALELSR